MKVIAFNGSPHKEGNTYHALKLVCDELEKQSIETEIICVGNKDIRGCIACYQCAKNQDEKCVLPGNEVNDAIQKMKEADGILLGSPVHFSGLGSKFKCFLDRVFYVSSVNGKMMQHKVGAAVTAVRRSGGMPTFQQLNIYFLYSQMFLATSNYWNVIHGQKPGQVHEDAEGVQIMQVLGQNMAYLMKMVEVGKKSIEAPEPVKKIYTNFVR